MRLSPNGPTPHQRVQFLREAGEVRRCHVTPLARPYNIALHSFNAVNLLLLLHPSGEPTLNLVRALMWHDAAERTLGDLPAPPKWESHLLASAYEELEQRVNRYWGIDSYLSHEDKQWLQAIDKLELFLFSIEEVAYGNLAFREYVDQLKSWFDSHRESIPREVDRFIRTLTPYERLPNGLPPEPVPAEPYDFGNAPF